MSRLDPGTLVDGRFRVLGYLGGGKPSDVYKVEATRSTGYAKAGTELALKVFKPWVVAQPKQRDRIKQELDASRMTGSPRVVRSYEQLSGEVTGLVMKLVDGESLDRWLVANPEPGTKAILQIAKQTAQGIRLIHAAGLIHRDIKPQNIMVNGDDTVVLDLGVVRPQVDPTITSGFQFLGTIPYAAPEYLFGEPYSEAVDVYSWGSVLHELAIGQPFMDQTQPWSRQVEAKRHASYAWSADSQARLLHRHGFRVGNFLHWLLGRALNPDPDERPSIDEIVGSFTRKGWTNKWPRYLHRWVFQGNRGHVKDQKTGSDLYTKEIDAQIERAKPIVGRSVAGSLVAGMIVEATTIGGGWPPKDISFRHLVSGDVDEYGEKRKHATNYLLKHELITKRMHKDGFPIYHLSAVAWRLALDGHCDPFWARVEPRPWWEFVDFDDEHE